MIEKAPSFKSPSDYVDFQKRVRCNNRYIRSKEDEEFLQALINTHHDRVWDVEAGRQYMRAQLGYDSEGESRRPYSAGRMTPHVKFANKGGRGNPPGVCHLYLSTLDKTAVSEVRPWQGALVSVAIFETVRDLKIVDLAKNFDQDRIPLVDNILSRDGSMCAEVVWSYIDKSFAEPMSSEDDPVHYIPTQIIAELFKKQGLDGIAYKSNFGGEHGFNIMLFDPSSAAFVSSGLVEVTQADYSLEKRDE